MSTNCSISVKTADRKFRTIYCHWDGYPQHTGNILNNHYNSQEMAEVLVAMGDASYIESTIGKSQFYGKSFEPRVYDNIKDVRDHEAQEFNYFWIGGKWYVSRGREKRKYTISRALTFTKWES